VPSDATLQTSAEAGAPSPAKPLTIAGLRDTADRPHKERTGRAPQLGAPLAALAAGAAVLAATLPTPTTIGPGQVVSAVAVLAWLIGGVVVAVRRPDEASGPLMLGVALAGAVGLLGAVLVARHDASASARDLDAACRALGVALVPAVGLHLALGLPDGRLRSRTRRGATVLGYAAAVGVAAAVFGARPSVPWPGLAALAATSAAAAALGYLARCRRATPADRARLQWAGWGVLVVASVAAGAAILNLLLVWPRPLGAIAVGASTAVPLALAAAVGTDRTLRVDRLLVVTITLIGLLGLVSASYALVVVGFGHVPTSSERSLLVLSLLAAALAALLWVPARERLVVFATRRVYGERHAPDELLRSFGSRLTRALPLDELLLQLAESLKATMALDAAEVWTRPSTGRLERAVSVPERGPAVLTVGSGDEEVVARAGVSGPAWARVWLPALLPEGDEEPLLRVAPITNSGELLGLMVVRRTDGGVPFDEDDDQAMTELARQVGLALHNVTLDSALQESIDEVRRQADELRVSRARIVQAGDAQRRAIERDLHDGAQQHLVALAVSLRLTRQVVATDAEQAAVMLDQIGADLQEAVQELRNLAHGIYPPLLAERGLAEALAAAAARAALPTTVEADDVGRYPQPTEAAVYFCVLEALQNAGKHAGADAQATITVREEAGALLFEVADDGAGFDAAGALGGHGFVNMADRVGAIGGTVTVESAPGAGTVVAGRIPLPG
jgi:signal transduction histidine kinase